MHTLRTKERYPKIYTIEQGGLRVQSLKNRKLPSESHVPFEQIRRDKFYHVERPTLLVLTGGIFFLILVLIAISSSSKENPNHYSVLAIIGFLSVLSFVSYFLYQQSFYFVKIFSGTFIRFRINNNAEQINEFVKTLIAERDEYLKKNYGRPNLHFSYDAQFSNFHIMHREGILSSEELESNLKVLNSIFEQTVPKNSFLGYSKN
ncbi:MAG TPA: hypothetical protein VIZ28_18600 [Chitinophagaceae bacterium]